LQGNENTFAAPKPEGGQSLRARKIEEGRLGTKIRQWESSRIAGKIMAVRGGERKGGEGEAKRKRKTLRKERGTYLGRHGGGKEGVVLLLKKNLF